MPVRFGRHPLRIAIDDVSNTSRWRLSVNASTLSFSMYGRFAKTCSGMNGEFFIFVVTFSDSSVCKFANFANSLVCF